tara:strand:- start:15 stop:665 length:651 start_codon:yes stop_codon:yes gene_type:complete
MFGPNREIKMQMDAEKRDQDFVRQRDVFNAAFIQDHAEMSMHQDSETKRELTRWQQDMDDQINQAVHDLRNEVMIDGEWVPQTEVVGIDKDGEPIMGQYNPKMNEYGIRAFVSSMRPLLSRNLMMSNYDEAKILSKLRGSVTTFILDLMKNYNLYGVRKQDMSAIIRSFRNHAEPAHYRALNNGERSYLNTIHKSVEAKTETIQPEKKKGFMGVFN